MKANWNSVEDGEQFYKQSKNFREALTVLLEKKLKKFVQFEDYETPAWSHKAADRNGYNRALQEVLELIK